MLLKSVTIRNYRQHGDLTVPFDSARTLIAGVNESGKSTLVEALHRALLCKAKGNTEYHRAMKSTLHHGDPEVQLHFDSAGISFILEKRFGSNGRVSLKPDGSVSLTGEKAEAELAKILNNETAISGKKLLNQWAHLWVWQGSSGDDPSIHITSQKDALIPRLQKLGASVVLQSDMDAMVAACFEQKVKELFTQKGKPKAGSPLERAVQQTETTREQLLLEEKRVDELEHAVEDVETATIELARVTETLQQLNQEKESVDNRIGEHQKLTAVENQQRLDFEEADKQLERLTAANTEIEDRDRKIERLENALKPQNESISSLRMSIGKMAIDIAKAEQDYRDASSSLRKCRQQTELARSQQQRFEFKDRQSKLLEKLESAGNLQSSIANLNKKMSQFLNVNDDKINTVRELESDYKNAATAVDAMAAAVEVLSTNLPVIVNGCPAEKGQEIILTDSSEIKIGDGVELRIMPGGGSSLADAKYDCQKAEDKLQLMLLDLGVKTVSEAISANLDRRTLAESLDKLKAELEGMDVMELKRDKEAFETKLNECEAIASRLGSQGSELTLPGSLAAANLQVSELSEQLGEAENRDLIAANNLKELRDQQCQLQAQLESAVESAQAKNDDLQNDRIYIKHLRAVHGEKAAREHSIDQEQKTVNTASKLLAETRKKITSLQPELLESDSTRIDRAITEKNSQANDLKTQIAVARAALRSDGDVDPRVSLATASALYNRAEAERMLVSRRAKAFDLLNSLFQEEQRSLADRFTQPLAEKITGYLRCVFGPEATAQVKLEKNEFTGLQLSRGTNETFLFSQLSGGAREQMAAAVRIAMAEVLAEEFGGTLPIVLDDAFTSSDPSRIAKLQRMLDLAANRGLQVIVLSCDPERYGGFGASHVTLKRTSSRGGETGLQPVAPVSQPRRKPPQDPQATTDTY
ncbi:AAA family ATPase [Rubripirellula sp.]|nr:AAA family ATPase [Rubripirellula sp.]